MKSSSITDFCLSFSYRTGRPDAYDNCILSGLDVDTTSVGGFVRDQLLPDPGWDVYENLRGGSQCSLGGSGGNGREDYPDECEKDIRYVQFKCAKTRLQVPLDYAIFIIVFVQRLKMTLLYYCITSICPTTRTLAASHECDTLNSR